MTPLGIALVFVGAGTGGVCRYLIGEAIHTLTRPANPLSALPLSAFPVVPFPWPTLIVNLTGCLAAGIVATYLAKSFPPDSPTQNLYRLAISVGFLGGYTTFSAFGRETLDLLQQNRLPAAAAYVLASTLLGLAAVYAGHLLAK